MGARRKPADDPKIAPPPEEGTRRDKGTGVDLRVFHKLMTKRFSKILAELAK